MTDYNNLAELRKALRSDDSETVQEAYKAVYDADLTPSEVQGSNPPVEKLRQAGVIPETQEEKGYNELVLQELRDIKAALQGGKK